MVIETLFAFSAALLFCWLGSISSGFSRSLRSINTLQFNLKDKPAGYLGSVLVGITFAVAWTPCVGPILGATLALASTAGEVGRGTLLLTSYAAGLALPFFLSALAVNSFFQFSQRLRRYIQTIHVIGGVLLIIVGILLITDYMTMLNAYVLRFTPNWFLQRL